MVNGKGSHSLPQVTVEFATSDDDPDNLTVEQIRGMICNPVYAGVGPYPPIVNDEAWVRAAAKMIEEEGAEQFLVNMLYMLRKSWVE